MKVYKIIKAPEKTKSHSYNFIFTLYLFSSKFIIVIEIRIIVKEQIIGDRTGPIHGTGIKNKISHVKRDDGQFNNIFNQT